MVKLSRIATLLIAILFLFSEVSPALAGIQQHFAPIRVVIDNKTTENIKLTLTGPSTVEMVAKPGKQKISLEPGYYSYSYRACGRNYTGRFEALQAGAELRLLRCSAPGKGVGQTGNAWVVFQNRTTAAIRLTLIGPKTYRYTLAPGNLRVEIDHGKYTVTYQACGENVTRILSTKKKRNQFTIPKCKGSGKGGAAANNQERNDTKQAVLLIHNTTNASLYIVLTGPQTYRITVFQGKMKLNVEPGRYSWTLSSSACGSYSTDKGYINVHQKAVWVWRCK